MVRPLFSFPFLPHIPNKVMLSTVVKKVARPAVVGVHRCRLSTTCATAYDAFQKSCYQDRGFVISEEETVQKAIEKLSNYGMGCLLTTDVKGVFFYVYVFLFGGSPSSCSHARSPVTFPSKDIFLELSVNVT